MEVAQKNWASALQTYRTALNAYRRLLELRVDRGVRTGGATSRVTLPITGRIAARRLEELTNREREVAVLIAQGYSNQQIADELVLTRGTVANHVAHILGKIGASNRTQIATRVLEGMPSEANTAKRVDRAANGF